MNSGLQSFGFVFHRRGGLQRLNADALPPNAIPGGAR